jgi:molybdopterin molybdotransferase
MTGAPVPEAADAIVPVEWTDAGLNHVVINQAPVAGQFIRPAAEDVSQGDLVIQSGTRLTPRHIGLLAAVGRNRAFVHPRPRVAVLSTGSELLEPGRVLRPGQIYDANGYSLTAAALDLGVDARYVGIIDDNPQIVLSALEEQLATADLLITSGGVSAGAYDVVKEVLSRLGTVHFTKVAMQPGMPQGFGVIGSQNTPIFALPGNPVSALVSFEILVRPVLRKMWGETTLHRHSIVAVATEGWTSPIAKRQFVRARLRRGEGDTSWVTPVGGQGSHLVADLAESNCLVVVPEGVDIIETGDEVRCLVLDRGRR